MRALARTLRAVVRRLIPAGRPRWALVALVLLGALLPVTELLVARLFAELITQPPSSLSAAVPGLLAFAGLFLATRGGHYLLRTRRIGYLHHALAQGAMGPPASESWRWALGLELLTVLTALAQLALVAAYVLHLAPTFGIANLAALAVLAEGIGRLFGRQLGEQRGDAAPEAARHRDTHARLRSRVLSAERGALLAAVAALVLLTLVVALSLTGWLTTATALVLFLAVRMQGTTLTTLSGAVMRLARAEARSQPGPARPGRQGQARPRTDPARTADPAPGLGAAASPHATRRRTQAHEDLAALLHALRAPAAGPSQRGAEPASVTGGGRRDQEGP